MNKKQCTGLLTILSIKRLPPSVIGTSTTIHHVRVVPTLTLPSKQPLSDAGIGALLLVRQTRLQDTRVRKIY